MMMKMWIVLAIVMICVLFLGVMFGMPPKEEVSARPESWPYEYYTVDFSRGTLNDITLKDGTRCIVYSGMPLGESGVTCDFALDEEG